MCKSNLSELNSPSISIQYHNLFEYRFNQLSLGLLLRDIVVILQYKTFARSLSIGDREPSRRRVTELIALCCNQSQHIMEMYMRVYVMVVDNN